MKTYPSKPILGFLRVIMLLPIVLVASVAFHGASFADDPPFYWEFIDVDIDVQENGDMWVTETQKYVFTGPYTNERYRYIPLDKVDRIDSVQVFEKEKELPVTTGVENNQLWIRWRHALHPPESHTFRLKYRVVGGLRIYPDTDQVHWKAISKDRTTRIQRSKVTVRLPDPLAGGILRIKPFGVPALTRKVDAQTAEFVSRGSLPPGKGLQVQVVFPHGLLAPPTAPQQKPSQGVGLDILVWILGVALSAVVVYILVKPTAHDEIQEWVSRLFPRHLDVWEQLSREIGAEIVLQEDVSVKIWWSRVKEYKIVAKVKEWTFELYHFAKGNFGYGQTIYTGMKAPYVHKDDFRFTIYRKTLFSGVGKLVGMQDVEVGDSEFDRNFIIKTNSVPRVRSLLANPKIRELIQAQPVIYFQSTETHRGIVCLYYEGQGESRYGAMEDVQRLKSLFELFEETLHQLCHMGSAAEEPPIFPRPWG